jgi:hypothetical protein
MHASTAEEIVALVTPERLSSYRSVAGGAAAALRLYEWNMVVSAAVLPVISKVEVVVRNALDVQLCAWARGQGEASWLDVVPLEVRGLEEVRSARRKAGRRGASTLPDPPHGKVVAELPLGFWRFLCARRYLTSLWVPCLYRAFAHHPESDLQLRRTSVERRLASITYLRNRIAHHEPIHHLCMEVYLGMAAEAGSWISPAAGEWVATSAEPVQRLLRAKPG